MGKPQDVLEFAVDLGEIMLQFGGEIYRVEDTIRRILQAYQVERADVYVLSNGLFISVRNKNGQPCCLVRQVSLGTINLRGIAELNQLSRDVVTGECSLVEGEQRLDAIKEESGESTSTLCLSCGLGCGMYSFLLWMSSEVFASQLLPNLLAAFLIGTLLELVMLWMSKQNMTRLVRSLFGSMIVTVSCLVLSLLGFPISQDNVIISATLPLFPGIAFTTSIRDFFNGDHLSGVIHLVDALLTALCIAAGVGIVIMLAQTLS